MLLYIGLLFHIFNLREKLLFSFSHFCFLFSVSDPLSRPSFLSYFLLWFLSSTWVFSYFGVRLGVHIFDRICSDSIFDVSTELLFISFFILFHQMGHVVCNMLSEYMVS